MSATVCERHAGATNQLIYQLIKLKTRTIDIDMTRWHGIRVLSIWPTYLTAIAWPNTITAAQVYYMVHGLLVKRMNAGRLSSNCRPYNCVSTRKTPAQQVSRSIKCWLQLRFDLDQVRFDLWYYMHSSSIRGFLKSGWFACMFSILIGRPVAKLDTLCLCTFRIKLNRTPI